MGTRLTSSCEAFTLTVDEPRRGDHELQVEFVFAPQGPADRATIELRLCARRLGIIHVGDRWDTEAAVPGTRARLERGETGRLRFTRPLPPFVAAFRGRRFEFAVVVFAEAEDGSRRRLRLDIPEVASDAQLVVRGLPREEQLSPGPIRGLFRRRRPVATFTDGPAGTLLVELREAPGLTGGSVALAAVEYDRGAGQAIALYEPDITAVQAPLVPSGAGSATAQLRLPPATAAPASIECTNEVTYQGIRWLARIEIEDGGRKPFRARVPLHVGVER